MCPCGRTALLARIKPLGQQPPPRARTPTGTLLECLSVNRRWWGIVPLVALIATTSACPVTPLQDASTDVVANDPTLELGTGQSYFETVTERGGRVELIHGTQGGYHLFARLRFERLGPEVYTTFRVTPLAGGAPINTATERLRMAEGAGLVREGRGWASSNAILVVLTEIHAPAEVVGQRFRWEVTVRPVSSTQSTTTSHDITIVDEE